MIFVLFGATGDLAERMVLPSFYGLFQRGLLPDDWRLVGNGRGKVELADFRHEMKSALDISDVEVTEEEWSRFEPNLYFAGNGFTEDDPGELVDTINQLREEMGADTPLFHFVATPPSSFRLFTAGSRPTA